MSFTILLYGYQVGEAALSILHSMVAARSDLDDAGEVVTPTPRVKRILSSPRCLPHIAQVSLDLFRSLAYLSDLYRFWYLLDNSIVVSLFSSLNDWTLYLHQECMVWDL